MKKNIAIIVLALLLAASLTANIFDIINDMVETDFSNYMVDHCPGTDKQIYELRNACFLTDTSKVLMFHK